jgi:hypothetical protein
MQKVVGSSPIIRFRDPPETAGSFLLSDRKGCAAARVELRLRGYGGASMRGVALLMLVVGCAVCAGAAGAQSSAGPATCTTQEVRVHDEAVFGHFSTLAAAKGLKARAAKLGFAGIKIENEGCGDFEVEIDGADRQADRSSFATEAAKAGFPVTFEQIAPPMEYRAGQVVGVFARLSTVAAANALMGKLSHIGFLFIDLARVGSRWFVVMPQVPVKHALSIAHEVATAGYHIQFQPGTK